jgi:hypothetical protein
MLDVVNINFNVADVEFRCCRHVMLSFVLGRRAPDLDVARNTDRNMGHLGVVPGEEGGGPLMLHAT